MNKKILISIFAVVILAFVHPAEAQQAKKIPRIGFIGGTEGPGVRAFQRGLRDLGYVEGKNILIEYRYSEEKEDRAPSFVAELVQLKVDILVLITPTAIGAAKKATSTIPIVMVASIDPVATGLINNLARPGGNITGLTRLTQELSGKRLEILKEVAPTISRVAVLMDADSLATPGVFKQYEAAARAQKIPLQSLEVRGSNPDLAGAFRDAAKRRASALITIRGGLLIRHSKRIVDLAIKSRLPSMFDGTDYVEAGGLASYAANDTEIFRRAAVYVDKILKGAKPADLPVEQPTKFEFVINLKTAKQIGLTIPPAVLARADRVIR
jgi:putative ABC transport system substrate-binding protein